MKVPRDFSGDGKNWDDAGENYKEDVLKLWDRCAEVCVEVTPCEMKQFAFTLWEIDELPER